ncbi:nitronate monooxygenase [Burkholderia multivorans]|uniref:nitronate monooxygenase n=1 Tax=Burkholderia multivorans TaxID=87883 RepID=UPI000D002D1B|nr:nitronate monooxygenase [Burkholderia multivorans]MBU9399367.1 nitronate monooxygenase [Burkholderia multivorans]MDN8048311.1 nitronate monooxygenase [Burkholderia multivorans]PRH27022.1 2-nitropropane dioxygenase [Burkholderia multivorans]
MSNPVRGDGPDARAVPILHRPVCDLLGCTWPIVLAGMGGVARSALASAVSAAGGFGFLGMVREPVELIRREVQQVRAATDRPFGINLIAAATPPELLDAQLDACIELRVPVVALFWDVMPAIVRRLRDAGIRVVHQVGTVDDAQAAEAAGADALIVQGHEAGGHVRGDRPLTALLPDVVGAVQVPVLAAGGIVDGAGVAAAMALGAQGAAIGTAFLATHESFAHAYHKQRIVDAHDGDTLLTDIFHINWPRGAKVRVLPSSVTRGERGDPFGDARVVIGDEEGRPIYLFSTDSPLRTMTGDFEAMALYAGTGAGRIRAVEPAADVLRRIVREAAAILESRAAARSGHDADAQRTALLAALDELLEAERAGARVASETAAEVTDDDALHRLIAHIRQDEAHWCSVLVDAIRTLGATPTRATGAFYEKAMAIDDLAERMAFLNRGQRWVVRRLQALLPTLADRDMHEALTQMLVAHEKNIGAVDVRLRDGGVHR